MSYADGLKSLLKPIEGFRYYTEICRDIDVLGRRMEDCGHLSSDIRKFLRRAIGMLGGSRMSGYLYEFFISGWADNLLTKAERTFDLDRSSNSFGLFWHLAMSPGGGIDECRQYVDILSAHRQPTMEEFRRRRQASEDKIRKVWADRGEPLPHDWRLHPEDY